MVNLPNRKSFEDLWEKVIEPEIKRYLKVSSVTETDNAKEKIWEAYEDLNIFCKSNFMSESVKKLDRHKIAACYIYAVVKTQPLSMERVDLPKDMVVTINEHLAITVGMSILYKYMEQDGVADLSSDGLEFPGARHGEYRDDFALELYYTRKYDMYNILSLSNTLFLLEMYNTTRTPNK